MDTKLPGKLQVCAKVTFLFALECYYAENIMFCKLRVICQLADHFFHGILRIRKNSDGTKEKDGMLICFSALSV
jgi:hypothetical protein